MKEKTQYMGNTAQSFHSIIKYHEFKETHKNHQIKDLAPQRTSQNSNHCLRVLSKCFLTSGSSVL